MTPEFPQIGSYCLFQDSSDAPDGGGPQLAQVIQRFDDGALISLPLKAGASGNRRVVLAELCDATALSIAEERELTDLANQIRGRDCRRSKRLRAAQARHDGLRSRLIWSGCMLRQLDRLRAMTRQQDQAA